MREIDQDLIAAAWRNDVDEARRLIAQGADVNAQDDTQQSAYLIATSEGYHDLLVLTLEHGADIAAKDSYNGTGLIRAAERGHGQVVGTLLRAGIEIDHINNLGWTALHEAIILGGGDERHLECVRLILACGGDPELASKRDGVAPIEHSASRGYDDMTRTLQAVIDAPRMSDPQAALDEAIAAGDADAFVIAMRAGADPELVQTTGAPLGESAVHRLLRWLTGKE
jgi:ankyrin repeat protein